MTYLISDMRGQNLDFLMMKYLISDMRGRNLYIWSLFKDNPILTKLRRYCWNLSAVVQFFLKNDNVIVTV